MKVVIYSRVSTKIQGSDGVSLNAQHERCEEFCKRDSVNPSSISHYSDVASGKKMSNRQGLKDALNSLNSGDKFIVYSISRLSRSTRDVLSIVDQLIDQKVEFVSYTENLDTSTPHGQMTLTVLAAMAQLERSLTAERTRDAMQYKKSQNERVGTIPYGSELEDNNVNLKPNADEIKTVNVILSMREKDKLGYLFIANTLNAHKDVYKPRGKKWYAQTIKYIINQFNPELIKINTVNKNERKIIEANYQDVKRTKEVFLELSKGSEYGIQSKQRDTNTNVCCC